MRTENEIKDAILTKQEELRTLIENGEKEERMLTEDETSNLDAIQKEIADLNDELRQAEEQAKKEAQELRNKVNNKENKENKMEVRLFDLIKEVANGKVSEEHRSLVNGNEISFRAAQDGIQATATDYGKENVPTYKQPLELAIRNATVLDKIGCRWFGNAVGDIKLVKYNGSSVEWAESENADAEDGKNTFSEVTLSPKRLTAYLTVSRQFLAQSPEDAEAILIADLARAIANKIDETLFGDEAAETYKPGGLFNADDNDYVVTGESLSNITFDNVLDIEAAVEGKNGTDFIFVTDPKVKYALRGTQMASGLRFVWENGEIDGRKAVVSNSVKEGGLLCFDPADLAAASWDNGMVITVDPYTLAGKNQIKLVVNYLFDAKLKGDRIAAEVFDTDNQ